MQLFIPSVITIVIAAVLAFLVIPRTGAFILASVSLFALIAVGFHHYHMFSSEYMLSTWQNGIAENAPFFILALAFVFIISSILFMFQGETNNIKNLGGAVNSVQEALAAPLDALSESVENVMNTKPSNANSVASGLIQQGNAAVTAVTNLLTGNTGNVNKPANANNTAGKKTSPMIPGLGFRASEI